MRKIKITLAFTLFFSIVALAGASHTDDPYQLLRQPSDGFKQVIPGKTFDFPRDHYPHEDFKIEWWYLTANLKSESGVEYGVHWTLFRQAMNPKVNLGGWRSNQTWMAHTAISTPKGFSFSQRFARGGIGQAGVSTPKSNAPFEAWIDDWTWRSESESPFPAKLSASTQDGKFNLSLKTNSGWVLQGNNGFSRKSDFGQASYYYSQPFIDIKGSILLDGEIIEVSGKGWLDREWSSQPLASNQAGWDWLSLHLNDGSALMVYQLRQASGKHYISGTWVTAEGQKVILGPQNLSLSTLKTTKLQLPGGAKTLPLHWNISVPSLDLELEVEGFRPNSWLETVFPYWEGPVKVSGSHVGSGYLELTGY
jgi:predicted secreted hydrolase